MRIRQSDTSVELITEAIHENIYEKLIDSLETEEEKKNVICGEAKKNTTKNKLTETRRLKNWIATVVEHPIGPISMIIRKEERRVQNAANWDITPNAAALHEKKTQSG